MSDDLTELVRRAANPDAYATWRPDLATDEPDGYPDRAVVPLVEMCRSRGVITLQSCAGHEGSNDGHIWFALDTFPPDLRAAGEPFSLIREVVWPQRRYELWWHPRDRDAAVTALFAALSATDPGEQKPQV